MFLQLESLLQQSLQQRPHALNALRSRELIPICQIGLVQLRADIEDVRLHPFGSTLDHLLLLRGRVGHHDQRLQRRGEKYHTASWLNCIPYLCPCASVFAGRILTDAKAGPGATASATSGVESTVNGAWFCAIMAWPKVCNCLGTAFAAASIIRCAALACASTIGTATTASPTANNQQLAAEVQLACHALRHDLHDPLLQIGAGNSRHASQRRLGAEFADSQNAFGINVRLVA